MTSTSWELFKSVCYLTGRGLTFGAPILPPNAKAKNVFSIVMDTIPTPQVSVMGEDSKWVVDRSMDHVWVGERLAAVDDPRGVFNQLSNKVKVGGHLAVFVPVGKEEPGIDKLEVRQIRDWFAGSGRWQIKEEELREGNYLLVAKRLISGKGLIEKKPITGKRACIVRYGAMGDGIILTPLIRALAEDGYQVTLNITSYSQMVFENNPYVANVILQEKDAIPNQQLGEYWKMWAREYDRYINLSESLEGDLLKVEGRREFFTHKAWRHKTCDKNYYDYTLAKGGYDRPGQRGEIYLSAKEERWAREKLAGGDFTILWALNGSSHHKVYPLMEPVMVKWLDAHPGTKLITVGDDLARLLEFEHPQIQWMAGKTTVRETLALTKFVDLVIGPETMVTNASGCWATPKITLLSHSTHENLCKYWENDFCLAPDVNIAPCYPCHQLHYTKESCPNGVMINEDNGEELGNGPVCAMGAITMERLTKRIDEVYGLWLQKRN